MRELRQVEFRTAIKCEVDEESRSCQDKLLELKLNILFLAGCNPDSVDCYGRTPTDFARHFEHSKIWKAALKTAGTDIDGYDNKDLCKDSCKIDDDVDTASNGGSDQVDNSDGESASQDLDSDGGAVLEDP